MTGASVPGIARGCGTRSAGSVYLECNVSPYGTLPMTDFLLDPPLPFAVDCKLGVSLQERQGTTMVIDHIGSAHYPNATDFLVEGMRFGFSRKISPNLDLSRIQPGSRLLFVHDRGLVTNPEALRPFVSTSYQTPEENGVRKPLHGHNCMKLHRTSRLKHYQGGFPGCIRDLWCLPEATSIVEEGERVRFFRDFASVRYEVFPPSPDAPRARTASALIAALPITNITVIKAPDGSHTKTASVLEQKLGVPIPITISDS